MKRIKLVLILFFVALISPATLLAKGDQLLVGGSGWNKIMIFDKDTKEIIWSFQLPDGGECNSVKFTKSGNVAFSFSKGAAVVTLDGRTLFEFKSNPGEEAQSISEIKGGYLIGVCGNPSRILEISKYGEIKKEIKYDLGISSPHGQHRQIKKTSRGTYLVPVLGKGEVIELNDKGETIRSAKVKGVLFSITELPNGNWLTPCGDSGYFVEVNPDSGEVVSKVDSQTIGDGIKLGFVAEIIRYKNGNTLICNWLGHGEDKAQPIMLELNKENKVIWKLSNGEGGIGAVSAVCPLNGSFHK